MPLPPLPFDTIAIAKARMGKDEALNELKAQREKASCSLGKQMGTVKETVARLEAAVQKGGKKTFESVVANLKDGYEREGVRAAEAALTFKSVVGRVVRNKGGAFSKEAVEAAKDVSPEDLAAANALSAPLEKLVAVLAKKI